MIQSTMPGESASFFFSTAAGFGLTGLACGGTSGVAATGVAAGSAAAQWTNFQTAYDAGTTSGASVATTTGNIMIVEGVIRPLTSGTVQLRFAPETATTNGIVIKAGSTLEWW